MSYAASTAPVPHSHKLSQINLQKSNPAFMKAFSIRYLGFTDTNRFLMVADYSYLDGLGAFKWIDIHSGKLVQTLSTGTINTDTAILSSNGHTIFATDQLAALLGKSNRLPIVNHVRVMNSTTLVPQANVDVGSFRDVFGVGEMAERRNILVETCSLSPDKDKKQGFDYSDPCLEIWAWKTPRLVKRMSFIYAYDVDYVVSTTDGSKYCCVVADEQTHMYGRLYIFDSLTGRLLREIRGNEDSPVDDPIFYLPDGRLVSKNKVYDTPQADAKLFMPDRPRLRCVSGALSSLDDVFFQSDSGLELWNVKKHRLIERWPQVKNVAEVYVSPNHSVVGIVCSPDTNTTFSTSVKNTSLQFWTLDHL